MDKETGGPAFPKALSVNPHNQEIQWDQDGMTLWDYFFNEQVAAIISSLMARSPEAGYKDDSMITEAVWLGQRVADAMIAERAKGV